MKTAALVATDPALTDALQTAASRHDLLLVTASSAGDIDGLMLVQNGQALHGHPDGAGSEPVVFPLPVRLGAVVDWLLHQQRRVPSLELGAHGRLEVQARRLVRPDETVVALTEKEVEMIATLAEAGAPVPRDELMVRVWGYSPDADTHTLETHIYRLRQKLEAAGVGTLLLSGEAGYYLAQG